MIVIKGMEELPGKCMDCPLFDWHYKDCLPAGGHSVDDDPEFDIMTGKPDWCPLVFLDTAVMPTVKDGVVSAEIKSFGLGMGKALLCYSCSSKTEKRHLWKWESMPAEVNGKTISAKIPEGVTQCFLSVYEENNGKFNDLCGTTEIVDLTE